MYSPHDALIVRNIYIESFFCILVRNVYQDYPGKSFIYIIVTEKIVTKVKPGKHSKTGEGIPFTLLKYSLDR